MPLVLVIVGVILLLVLIVVFKLHAFLAFILVALFLGVSMGLPIDTTIESIKIGMGSTLGSLVMILGFRYLPIILALYILHLVVMFFYYKNKIKRSEAEE